MSVAQDDLVAVAHVGEGVEEVGRDDVGDSLEQTHFRILLQYIGAFRRAEMNGLLRTQ